MHNPLGSAVGNALEVRESVRLLKNEPVPDDLADEVEPRRHPSPRAKRNPGRSSRRRKALSLGRSLREVPRVRQRPGRRRRRPGRPPRLGRSNEVKSPRDGYVARFAASGIGSAALALGAGRGKKGDRIDPGSGIEVLVRAGDPLQQDQPVARLYGEREAERAERLVLEALEISDEPVERPPAILDSL